MAERVTYLENDAEGVPAEDWRLMTATFVPSTASGLHAYAGVIPAPAGFVGEVTLLGPEAIRVNPARWVVPGTQSGVQGDYVVTNDAPVERSIGPRDATLTRVDRLVVQVRDTQYTPNEGVDDNPVRVVPGAPVVSGAVAPPAPPNSVTLGAINVPPGSGVVTFSPTILARQVGVGGIPPVQTGEPARNGTFRGEYRDHPTRALQRWSGSAWTTPHTRFWGAVDVLPAAAQGAERGDTAYLTPVRTLFAFDPSSTPNWRQMQVTLVRDDAARLALSEGANAAETAAKRALLHDGFHVHQTTGNAFYSWNGGDTWDLIYSPGTQTRPGPLHILANGDVALASTGHPFQIGPNVTDPDLEWFQAIHDVNESLWRRWNPNLNGGAGGWELSGWGVSAANVIFYGNAAGVNDVRLYGTQGQRADNAVMKSWLDGPSVRVRRAAAGGVPTGTWTNISWTINDHDTDGMWASGSNVTIKRDGYYLISAGFSTGPAAAGRRGVRVMRNGAVTTIGRLTANDASQSDIGVETSDTFRFVAGEVITVQGYQDSGVTVNTGVTDFSYPSLSMQWIRS